MGERGDRLVSPYAVVLAAVVVAGGGGVLYVRGAEPLVADVFASRPGRAVTAVGAADLPAFAEGAEIRIGIAITNRGRLPVRVEDVGALVHPDVETMRVELEQASLRPRSPGWRLGPVPFHAFTVAPNHGRRLLLHVRLRSCSAQPAGAVLSVSRVPVRFSIAGAARTSDVPMDEALQFRYTRSLPGWGCAAQPTR